jgi:hypothetical protein
MAGLSRRPQPLRAGLRDNCGLVWTNLILPRIRRLGVRVPPRHPSRRTLSELGLCRFRVTGTLRRRARIHHKMESVPGALARRGWSAPPLTARSRVFGGGSCQAARRRRCRKRSLRGTHSRANSLYELEYSSTFRSTCSLRKSGNWNVSLTTDRVVAACGQRVMNE